MYKAQNIDTDKALTALDEARKRNTRERTQKINEAQKYYEGVEDGLYIAEQLFLCPNYEKEGSNDQM